MNFSVRRGPLAGLLPERQLSEWRWWLCSHGPLRGKVRCFEAGQWGPCRPNSDAHESESSHFVSFWSIFKHFGQQEKAKLKFELFLNGRRSGTKVMLGQKFSFSARKPRKEGRPLVSWLRVGFEMGSPSPGCDFRSSTAISSAVRSNLPGCASNVNCETKESWIPAMPSWLLSKFTAICCLAKASDG